MKISVVAIGRLKSGPEKELFARYWDRASALVKNYGFRNLTVFEIPESKAGRAGERKRAEAAEILAKIDDQDYLILLDERGKTISSEAFTKKLVDIRDHGGKNLCFVIGGADGLDAGLRERADNTISFGEMTWPHQLVRVLLAEQIYRALTLLAGHPYHKS